jgi:hypothetical protein
VQNVGDSPVKFTAQSVYLNGAQAAMTEGASVTLAAGATQRLNATLTQVAGTTTFTVDIKVTTEDGTFSTMHKTFP